MSQVSTVCRDCVFAEYNGDVATDRGCILDRIEKFEERGAVIEGWDDGQKKFLKVVGRVCPFNHREDSPILAGLPPSEWPAKAREFAALKAFYVIYAGKDADVEGVVASIGSATPQIPSPSTIIVVLDECEVPVGKLAASLSKTGFSFEIVVMEDWTSDEEKAAYQGNRFSRAIDAAVAKIKEKRGYYTVIEAGKRWPPDFAKLLDEAQNDEMHSIIGVVDDTFFAAYIAVHHHPLVIGNQGVPITEKFDYVVEESKGMASCCSMEFLRCMSPSSCPSVTWRI